MECEINEMKKNEMLMKQFVTAHRFTVLQETQKTWPIISKPTCKHVMFLWKCKDKQFWGGTTFWQKVYS